MPKAMVRWDNPSQLQNNLMALSLSLEKNIDARMAGVGDEMVGYAQGIAPWQDRTGNARAGFVAEYARNGRVGTITFGNTVFYVKFLEFGTRFMAPYPSIRPTLEAFYPRIMSRFAGLLGGG